MGHREHVKIAERHNKQMHDTERPEVTEVPSSKFTIQGERMHCAVNENAEKNRDGEVVDGFLEQLLLIML